MPLLVLAAGGVAWLLFARAGGAEGVRTLSDPRIERVLGLRFEGDRVQVVGRDGALFEEGEASLHALTQPQSGGFRGTAWDGEVYALAALDLRVVDVQSGRARQIPGVEQPLSPIVSEGLLATTSSAPGRVQVHSLESGARVWEVELTPPGPGKKHPQSHLAHAGGLVALSMSDRIALFEASTGAALPALKLPAGFVPKGVALDRRGTRLAAIGRRGGACVWSLPSFQLLLHLRSEGTYSALALSELGDQVALGSLSGELYVYALSGELVARFPDPDPVSDSPAADRGVAVIAFGDDALAWSIKDRVLSTRLWPASTQAAVQARVSRALGSYRSWSEAGTQIPASLCARWRETALRDLQGAMLLRAELPPELREAIDPAGPELARALRDLEEG